MAKINWRIPLAFIAAPAASSASITLIVAYVSGQWNGVLSSVIVMFAILAFACLVPGVPIYLILNSFRKTGRLDCILGGLIAGIILSVFESTIGILAKEGATIVAGGITGFFFGIIGFRRETIHDAQTTSIRNLLAPRKLLLAGIIVIIVSPIFWLGEKVSTSKIEDSMFTHLDRRLDRQFTRIDCYAEAVGKSFRPEFACTYMRADGHGAVFKYIDVENDIHVSSWAFAPNAVDFIFFDRQSSPKLFYQIHSYGVGSDDLTNSNAYWMDALADAIEEGQPR